MTTHPTADELLEAVSRFIEERAAPRLEGRDAFLARVAVNALAAVRREMELGPHLKSRAAERLAELLGAEGEFEALNAELCARLADETMAADAPEVLAHLRASVIDQLRIDQPNYSGLRRMTSEER